MFGYVPICYIPNMNRYSDDILIARIKEGNKKAFNEIYRRYWAILYRHAMRMTKSDDESQDVVQDVFESLWRNRAFFEINTSLSSYLYSAVRYKIFDLLDKNKVRTDYMDRLSDFIEEGIYTIDHVLIEKELSEQIEKEVSFLPPKMREVFELSRNEHLTHKEIAVRLSLSDQTVKKQIHKALKILKPKFRIFI